MDPEIKKNIVKIFLQRLYAEQFQESWLDDMERYNYLDEVIEYINEHFFDLNELSPEDPKFNHFVDLAKHAVQFSDEIPPTNIGYDLDDLDDLLSLPNANYIQRRTNLQPIIVDEELNHLKKDALKVLLKTTVKSILPNSQITTREKLKQAIEFFEKEYKREKNSEAKSQIKSILSLLKNVDKISQLTVIDIPNEQGIPSRFCTMAEAAGGVTEKISVTPRDVVIEKLQSIVDKGLELNFTDFRHNTSDYDLKTQGILKLPKHGKTIEVQREAIALNISRILGFSTTESTMVNHNGKVALYVPFDNIQLMKEFAQGETQRVLLPSGITKIGTIGDTYLHHSTITPVGNGLNCDIMLHDFGPKVAFSFLCNDTDFIGGYNQNKAIIGGRELYIFDQVVMSSDKMDFDTRLSMIPTGIKRHSRHNQGRNRSIVEDSSFDTKFSGILHLLDNQEKINMMLDNIILTHAMQLNDIELKINALQGIKLENGALTKKQNEDLKFLTAEKNELIQLKTDAETIKETINTRITNMFKHFPSINRQPMTPERFLAHQNEIKPALALEKLVNNPVLFTNDGRPYRNTWTTRNNIRITAISEQDDTMRLTFSEFNPSHLIDILQSAGVDIPSCQRNGNTLIIPKAELLKINENSLHPERSPFSMNTEYLQMKDVKLMSAGYSGGNFKFAKEVIGHYQVKIIKAEGNPKKIASAMRRAIQTIQNNPELNPGFAKHLELKVQLDIQQKLRPIILDLITDHELREGMENKLGQAYEAAIKLDRLNDLNHVLMQFIKNPVNTNQRALNDYLDSCIEHGEAAIDYNSAKHESLAMLDESQQAYNAMPNRIHNPMLALGPPIPVLGQDWEEDVVGEQNEQLERQREIVQAIRVDLPVENLLDEERVSDLRDPQEISVKL